MLHPHCGGPQVGEACVRLRRGAGLLGDGLHRTRHCCRQDGQGAKGRASRYRAPGKRRGKWAGCSGESEKSYWKRDPEQCQGKNVKNRDEGRGEISDWGKWSASVSSSVPWE